MTGNIAALSELRTRLVAAVERSVLQEQRVRRAPRQRRLRQARGRQRADRRRR